MTKIKDFVILSTSSIYPKEDIVYNLYSLPAFDNEQKCEILRGKDIQSNKYIVPDKCILFNKLNVRFKRVWRIDSLEEHKLCSTEFLPLIIDETKVDYQYFFYLLISDSITNYLCGQNANTSGSHKRISPADLLEIPVKLPSMPEQKAIGKILSDIDRKIALNRAINHNLAAMAKQLYDYWFVQFDFPNQDGKPYKSSRGKMVWNEKLKREIPEGWEVISFNNLFNLGNGKATPNSVGNVPAYGGNGIIKYVKESNFCSCFIIGRVGANCGSLHYSPINCWVSDNAIAAIPKNQDNASYLLYSLKLYDLAQNKGGSSQPLITHNELKKLYFLYSNEHVIRFCNIINKQLNLYFDKVDEIETLTKQRDELLPLLMNGQVTIG